MPQGVSPAFSTPPPAKSVDVDFSGGRGRVQPQPAGEVDVDRFGRRRVEKAGDDFLGDGEVEIEAVVDLVSEPAATVRPG